MGYRSEVAIAIKPDSYISLIESVPENSSAIRELISMAEVHSKEDGVLIHWSSIKWYGNSCDKFMDSLRRIDPDHWRFLSIGEEDLDDSMKGAWWNNPFGLAIERKIYMELGD